MGSGLAKRLPERICSGWTPDFFLPARTCSGFDPERRLAGKACSGSGPERGRAQMAAKGDDPPMGNQARIRVASRLGQMVGSACHSTGVNVSGDVRAVLQLGPKLEGRTAPER